MWRSEQSPIQPVGPGMIRTLDRLAKMSFAFLANACAAVTADVVERLHVFALVADNDHTFARDLGQEVISWRRNVTLMTHRNPLFGKNAFLFLSENFCRDQVVLRQSPRAVPRHLCLFPRVR